MTGRVDSVMLALALALNSKYKASCVPCDFLQLTSVNFMQKNHLAMFHMPRNDAMYRNVRVAW